MYMNDNGDRQFLYNLSTVFLPQKVLYPFLLKLNPTNFSVPFYLACYPFNMENLTGDPILKSFPL